MPRGRVPTHGHRANGGCTPTYVSWTAMWSRTTNQNADHPWHLGLPVSDRWRSFPVFLADMGERPKGTTLDRIDGTKGYEPGNCRWANNTTQGRNKRTTKLTMEKAEQIRLMAALGNRGCHIARLFGVKPNTVCNIVKGRRWAVEA